MLMAAMVKSSFRNVNIIFDFSLKFCKQKPTKYDLSVLDLLTLMNAFFRYLEKSDGSEALTVAK
jgi:hypothetical protein